VTTPMYPADLSELKDEAPYVNCREFAAWLEDRFTLEGIFERMCSSGSTDRWTRRYYHWKKESLTNRVQVGKVDEFLMDVFGIEVMINDLPDWLFAYDTRAYGNSPATKEMREAALARIAAGETASQVAEDIGRSVSTVAKWATKARRQAAAA
jgi:hypothetical protein